MQSCKICIWIYYILSSLVPHEFQILMLCVGIITYKMLLSLVYEIKLCSFRENVLRVIRLNHAVLLIHLYLIITRLYQIQISNTWLELCVSKSRHTLPILSKTRFCTILNYIHDKQILYLYKLNSWPNWFELSLLRTCAKQDGGWQWIIRKPTSLY